jgi:hypothetical protein
MVAFISMCRWIFSFHINGHYAIFPWWENKAMYPTLNFTQKLSYFLATEFLFIHKNTWIQFLSAATAIGRRLKQLDDRTDSRTRFNWR